MPSRRPDLRRPPRVPESSGRPREQATMMVNEPVGLQAQTYGDLPDAPESFDDFVVARGRALLRFAYVVSGDAYLAEDLVQEVLARLHRRWDKVVAMQHPEAYVRTSIVRQFVSWRRRRSAREAILAEVPEPGALADPHQGVLARDQMWRLLARLPRAQRAVLVLRFYCDLPDDEIAALLGCGESTVRSRASRALARLRIMLGE